MVLGTAEIQLCVCVRDWGTQSDCNAKFVLQSLHLPDASVLKFNTIV